MMMEAEMIGLVAVVIMVVVLVDMIEVAFVELVGLVIVAVVVVEVMSARVVEDLMVLVRYDESIPAVFVVWGGMGVCAGAVLHLLSNTLVDLACFLAPSRMHWMTKSPALN